MFTKEMTIVANQIKSLLDLLPMLTTIEKQLGENVRDLDMIADVTFLSRKADDLFEVVQKRLHAIERKAAIQADEVFSFIEEKKYSNDNCTISSNSEPYVKFPTSPSVEGFEAFVKQLPTSAVRPHFPTVTQLIMEKLVQGSQLPFGLPAFGILSINPKLRCTSKKEL